MIVDILVLIVLAISAIIAFVRGFIRELLTIVGVLGGFFAAYYGGPVVLPMMEGWLGVNPEAEEPQRLFDIIPYAYVAATMAYGGVFIIVVIILSVLSHFIAEGAKTIGLGPIDRLLGIAFGALRGVLLLGILYLPVHLTIEEKTVDEWFQGSKSHHYIKLTADALANLLPDGAREGIESAVEDGTESAANANEIRGTLERLELLKNEQQNGAAPSGEAEPENGAGYNQNQRNEMDQLFENLNRGEGLGGR
ncbi:MAG: CvpA family protein [Alphaproteobacteria bacterium]